MKHALLFIAGSIIGTLTLIGIASAIVNYHIWGLG